MKHVKYVLTAAVLLWGPMTATASIRDGLDAMYMVTGNEPTIYDSQRRRGMDFGYLRLRAPVTTYSIVNFSPPSFDSGCGGLDLYGGSFSFIDADQFRQMLRQIGANALGYAFKIAIASMCPLCDSIMTGLSDKLQQLNALQVDTCKWGQGLAVNTAEALGMEVAEKYKIAATWAGSFSDTMEAVQALFANTDRALSDGDPSGCDPSNPAVCNLTINALRLTNAGDTLAFPATDGLDHNELLMNIAGTFIARGPSSTETEEGNFYGAWPARLTYTHLKNGLPSEAGSDNDAHPLQRCANTECYVFENVPQWGLSEGIGGWVREKLQDAADHMAVPATAGTPHPADLQVFLGSLPITVARHLMILQGNQAGLDAYVNAVSPYITDVYASAVALNLVRVIETAYSHARAADMPDTVKEAVTRFHHDALADKREVERKYADVWRQAEEIVATYARKLDDPGVFAMPGQR